jgi:hypothetical protein
MIEILQEMLPEIKADIRSTLDAGTIETWQSLIIDRRKPHTYRVFKQFGEHRVCLHRFEACDDSDAFAHPHPWPAAFLLLSGQYIQSIGGSVDLQSQPEFYMRELVRPRSMYEIINPLNWHKIQPLNTTYTLMINGPGWDVTHKDTRTTKGKDLKSMSDEEMIDHLVWFETILENY